MFSRVQVWFEWFPLNIFPISLFLGRGYNVVGQFLPQHTPSNVPSWTWYWVLHASVCAICKHMYAHTYILQYMYTSIWTCMLSYVACSRVVVVLLLCLPLWQILLYLFLLAFYMRANTLLDWFMHANSWESNNNNRNNRSSSSAGSCGMKTKAKCCFYGFLWVAHLRTRLLLPRLHSHPPRSLSVCVCVSAFEYVSLIPRVLPALLHTTIYTYIPQPQSSSCTILKPSAADLSLHHVSCYCVINSIDVFGI